MGTKSRMHSRHDDDFVIHDYDGQITAMYRKINKELPKRTAKLISQYDQVMINTPLAKATRRKHIQTVYSISKLVGKDWYLVTKDDIDTLVSRIMIEYADINGQE